MRMRMWKGVNFFSSFRFWRMMNNCKKSHISSKDSSLFIYISLEHVCQRPIGFHFSDNRKMIASYVDDDGQTWSATWINIIAPLSLNHFRIILIIQVIGPQPIAVCIFFWYFHFTNCISPYISSFQTSSLIRDYTQTPKSIVVALSVTHCQWLSYARICFCKTQPAWFLASHCLYFISSLYARAHIAKQECIFRLLIQSELFDVYYRFKRFAFSVCRFVLCMQLLGARLNTHTHTRTHIIRFFFFYLLLAIRLSFLFLVLFLFAHSLWPELMFVLCIFFVFTWLMFLAHEF